MRKGENMKILFVNACVREESRTFKLATELLAGLNGEIQTLNLEDLNLKPLDEEGINTRVTDLEAQKYAREFAESDVIVIAAPMWDLSFPAILKLYIENISISGVTFKYTEKGIVGLCKAKKLYYISTAGGQFVPNFGFEYIKSLANIIYGINEVKLFYSEGLDVWGNDVSAILNETTKKIEEYTKTSK